MTIDPTKPVSDIYNIMVAPENRMPMELRARILFSVACLLGIDDLIVLNLEKADKGILARGPDPVEKGTDEDEKKPFIEIQFADQPTKMAIKSELESWWNGSLIGEISDQAASSICELCNMIAAAHYDDGQCALKESNGQKFKLGTSMRVYKKGWKSSWKSKSGSRE